MEGPVRSMSRIPTGFPARESDNASWVVIEDLPTPPLPDKTYDERAGESVGRWGLKGRESDLPGQYA